LENLGYVNWIISPGRGENKQIIETKPPPSYHETWRRFHYKAGFLWLFRHGTAADFSVHQHSRYAAARLGSFYSHGNF